MLSELFDSGTVGYIMNVATNPLNSVDVINQAKKYPNMYSAVGIHPSDIEISPLPLEAQLADIAGMIADKENNKIKAIGEIGLDYYWEKDPKARANQQYWFRRQMNLAREKKLPIVIHSRDAAKDTLDIAKEEKLSEIGGVVHCFSYSVEMAREYLNMGMYLGIGGVLTYKNARVLKEVVDYAPMDRIVLETDSPYLTPVPNRGKRNSSLNLPYVVMAIAEIKGITTKEVEDITWENAVKMYRMSL